MSPSNSAPSTISLAGKLFSARCDYDYSKRLRVLYSQRRSDSFRRSLTQQHASRPLEKIKHVYLNNIPYFRASPRDNRMANRMANRNNRRDSTGTPLPYPSSGKGAQDLNKDAAARNRPFALLEVAEAAERAAARAAKPVPELMMMISLAIPRRPLRPRRKTRPLFGRVTRSKSCPRKPQISVRSAERTVRPQYCRNQHSTNSYQSRTNSSRIATVFVGGDTGMSRTK